MMTPITRLQWATQARDALLVTAGLTLVVPWPCSTWHSEYIENALNGGLAILDPPDPPPPVDQADIDNLERAVKALGLVTATWAGKTPAQLKAAFRTAWESLAP